MEMIPNFTHKLGYELEIMSKTFHIRDKREPSTHPQVRVKGSKGSAQNQLRAELYQHAIIRIQKAIDSGNFFEAVSLSDTLITDRIEAYIQFLLHNDELQQRVTSIGLAIAAMNAARHDKGVATEPDYKSLTKLLTRFQEMRNEVLHNFVVVKNANVSISLEERLSLAKETAIFGYEVFQEIKKFTAKHIKVDDGVN